MIEDLAARRYDAQTGDLMNRQGPARNLPKAFTLVELLVVVAIVVVLLALLAPALDRAMYQGMLVQCATQQRFVASAGITYGFDHRRHYPARPRPRNEANGGGFSTPDLVGFDQYPDADIRPLYAPLVDLKNLVDPLVETIDLSIEANPNTHTYGSYEIWMAWQYTGAHAGAGMHRVGDRLGWVDPWNHNVALTGSFLVSDHNGIHANNHTISSHPDASGVTFNWRLQTQPVPSGEGYNVTWSHWRRPADDSLVRGPLDLNVSHDDGSVARYHGVTGRFNDVHETGGTAFYSLPYHANTESDASILARRWLPAR
jgi:prepilin-type N-terminal cleavage/methylation domain-containing protein